MKLKVPGELQAAYDRLMKSAVLKLRRNDAFKKSTLAYLALGGEALARYHIEISQKDFPDGSSLQKFSPIIEPVEDSEDSQSDDDEKDDSDDDL